MGEYWDGTVGNILDKIAAKELGKTPEFTGEYRRYVLKYWICWENFRIPYWNMQYTFSILGGGTQEYILENIICKPLENVHGNIYWEITGKVSKTLGKTTAPFPQWWSNILIHILGFLLVFSSIFPSIPYSSIFFPQVLSLFSLRHPSVFPVYILIFISILSVFSSIFTYFFFSTVLIFSTLISSIFPCIPIYTSVFSNIFPVFFLVFLHCFSYVMHPVFFTGVTLVSFYCLSNVFPLCISVLLISSILFSSFALFLQ